MADITIEVGTQFRFCVSGSFSPASAKSNFTIGSPTNVVLTPGALANAAGRQSDKADLGVNRAPRYNCGISLSFSGETPTAGERVDVFWAPSVSSTAAQGNIAGNSGVDAAAPGSALPTGLTLDEFLAQCIFIGSLITSDDATVQCATGIGILVPPTRYGQIVVVNRSGDAFANSAAEFAVYLDPMIDDVA